NPCEVAYIVLTNTVHSGTYSLSLHDALPIYLHRPHRLARHPRDGDAARHAQPGNGPPLPVPTRHHAEMRGPDRLARQPTPGQVLQGLFTLDRPQRFFGPFDDLPGSDLPLAGRRLRRWHRTIGRKTR